MDYENLNLEAWSEQRQYRLLQMTIKEHSKQLSQQKWGKVNKRAVITHEKPCNILEEIEKTNGKQ